MKVVCYADDIILLVAGKDPGTLVDVMNTALRKVKKWGDYNGLVFNPEKTSTVRFSRLRVLHVEETKTGRSVLHVEETKTGRSRADL